MDVEEKKRRRALDHNFGAFLASSFSLLSFFLLRSCISSPRRTIMNATAMRATSRSSSTAVACRAAPAGRASAAVAPLRRSNAAASSRRNTSSSSSKLNGAAVANASSKTLAVERVRSDENEDDELGDSLKDKQRKEKAEGFSSSPRSARSLARRSFIGRSLTFVPCLFLLFFPPKNSHLFLRTDVFEEFEDEDDGTGLTGSQVRQSGRETRNEERERALSLSIWPLDFLFFRPVDLPLFALR